MLTSAPTLDPNALFARYDIDRQPAVVAAVSGGSDSLALLILLHGYLDARGLKSRLSAVTVDHGLRPGSAGEAQGVAAICARLGVEHHTLPWAGEKPRTGIQVAARAARYRLLCEVASESGGVLLTAHTQDDQAETVAMRAQRGSGIGLAGMADQALLEGRVWLVRPLLDASRAVLRDRLRRDGIAWFDDPSNDDPRYERVRTRKNLVPAERQRLLKISEAAATERRSLGERGAALLEQFVTSNADGVSIDPKMLRITDLAAVRHAMRFMLCAVGGRVMLPDQVRTAAMLESVASLGARLTLGNCVLTHRRDTITIAREPQRRGALALEPQGISRKAIISGFDLPLENRISMLLNEKLLPDPPFRRHESALL